jgi:hypothetical protein
MRPKLHGGSACGQENQKQRVELADFAYRFDVEKSDGPRIVVAFSPG